MLTPTDIHHYRDHGYLVLKDVFSLDELQELSSVIDRIVADAKGLTSHSEALDLEPSHTPDEPRVRRIKRPHLVDPFFRDLAGHRKIIAALRPLIGNNIRLRNGGKVNMKSPGYGAPVEWHQDWAFYPHTNDEVLAVGIMLDNADFANGPMMVIPGSHRGPVYDHHSNGVFCGAIDVQAAKIDVSAAVPLTGSAGSMTIHHARLIHGSQMNTSNHPRRFLLYEYAAVDAWPLAGVEALDDLTEFDGRIVSGEPTLRPRLSDVPVRVPLPRAPFQGSIYENQRTLANPYFEHDPERAGQ